MIWIVLILVVLGLSFWLALRSMKDYADIPTGQNGLFLIQNPRAFTVETLQALSQSSVNHHILSFERLYKGAQKALVIFGPRQVILSHSELGLLELEDYSGKVDEAHVQAWELSLKKGVKEMKRLESDIFHGLNLDSEEQVYLQIVSTPNNPKLANHPYQVTLRVIVVARDAIRRASLSKQVESIIEVNTPLQRAVRKLSSFEILSGFKKRSLYPRETKRFLLPALALRELLSY